MEKPKEVKALGLLGEKAVDLIVTRTTIAAADTIGILEAARLSAQIASSLVIMNYYSNKKIDLFALSLKPIDDLLCDVQNFIDNFDFKKLQFKDGFKSELLKEPS